MKDNLSNRTSYVIAPNGKILLAYSDPNFADHVTQTMDAVKAYKGKK
jgi:peroxiredoxin